MTWFTPYFGIDIFYQMRDECYFATVSMFMLLSAQAQATSVYPEARTTLAVSKTDINRISCANGVISSIDYAAGTGLTHTTHSNGKNVILLFQQLDTGNSRELIDTKVNLLISCNDEYYPLILDPQNIDSQSIFLQISDIEKLARKNRALQTKETEQKLVDLIQQSRADSLNDFEQSPDQNNEKATLYFNHFKLQLIRQTDIYGTPYRVKKYRVYVLDKEPNTQQFIFKEKDFLTSVISSYRIAALSLDDFELTIKDSTLLHVVIDKGLTDD